MTTHDVAATVLWEDPEREAEEARERAQESAWAADAAPSDPEGAAERPRPPIGAEARGDTELLAELGREWRGGDVAAGRRSGLEDLRTAVADLAGQVDRTRAELEGLTTTGLGEILFHERDPEAVVHRLAERIRTRIARRRRVLSEMRRGR